MADYWAAIKDLVQGGLKKCKVSEIVILTNGKKYKPFTPTSLTDFSSKIKYARVKQENDGVTRLRRVKLLKLRSSLEEIQSLMKAGGLPNPSCKLVPAELMSSYVLAEEKTAARSAKRKMPSVSDSDDIKKAYKKKTKLANKTSDSGAGGEFTDVKNSDITPTNSGTGEVLNNDFENAVEGKSDVTPTNSGTGEVLNNDFEKVIVGDSDTTATNGGTGEVLNNDFEKVIVGDSDTTATNGGTGEVLNNDFEKVIVGDSDTTATNGGSGELLDETSDEEPNAHDFVEVQMAAGKQSCCCADVLTEVRKLAEEVNKLREALTGETSCPSRIPKLLNWPISNAVSVGAPAPPDLQDNMIYCGKEARTISVSRAQEVIMSRCHVRTKIQALACDMYPLDVLKKMYLRPTKTQTDIFPMDSRNAIMNLINIGLSQTRLQGDDEEDQTPETLTNTLSKVLSFLRAEPKPKPEDDKQGKAKEGKTKEGKTGKE